MTNQSEKYIKSVIAQSGASLAGTFQKNTPAQYANRQHQYYAQRTDQFIKARAKYASDFVQANVQGLLADDFYAYVSTNIRFSDVVSQSAVSTTSSTKNVDDIKIILFTEPQISYFPVGAKLQTMGSTWICTNPSNISSVYTTAVVQRCNAAYSLYDYYGNIVTEPIIVEKTLMSSNDNGTPQNLVMMEGYFTVICQLNEYTRQLGQNQRIILGSKAYFITGFTDFIQEFTGDYDSVHLLRFSIRIEEPTDNDDLVNHIANGKNYSFGASISGADEIATGEVTQLIAHFIKNGEEVQATEQYPLTWQWTSFDTAVATVSSDGTVTAVGAGTTIITARLTQSKGQVKDNAMLIDANLTIDPQAGQLNIEYPNAYVGTTFSESGSALSATTPNNITPPDFVFANEADDPEDGQLTATVAANIVMASIKLTVTAQEPSSYISFIGVVPTTIEQYNSAQITAGYYEGGTLTDNTISWSFSGASEGSYYTATDGNTLTITCLRADSTLLTVTATFGEHSVSTQIQLEGY